MGDDAMRLTPVDPVMKLKERLETGEIIGGGGFAEVVEAFDANLNRRLALKRLKPDFERKPRERKALIVEAQVTAQLDHQNIVPVFELGTDKGKLFFAMKRVDGENLTEAISKYFKKRDDKKLRFLLDIFIKVCDAVAFAHSKGVLHGDIKPDNIMVGKFGEVYLMDWGSAKLMDEPIYKEDERKKKLLRRRTYDVSNEPDTISGTLAYMPVELAKGQPFDERSDIFCLGGVLYQILTNQPPFPGDSNEEKIEKIRAGKVPDPRETVSHHVYSKLSDIAMKALSESPAKRHASVNALKRAVQGFLFGESRFERKTFKAGSIIVRQGESGDLAYIISEGDCRVYVEHGEDTIVLGDLGVNDIFGETSLFTGAPMPATVEAINDVTVMVVRYEIFKEHFQDELGMGYTVGLFVKALSDRLLESALRVAELECRLKRLGERDLK